MYFLLVIFTSDVKYKKKNVQIKADDIQNAASKKKFRFSLIF